MPQEQRIRASNDIKQFGKKLKEQRLRVTDRVKKNVADVRVIPIRLTRTATEFSRNVRRRSKHPRTPSKFGVTDSIGAHFIFHLTIYGSTQCVCLSRDVDEECVGLLRRMSTSVDVSLCEWELRLTRG
jgi:hypothetical protein